MKKIQINIYLFSVILLFFASSCKKVVENINIDPNNPTSAPYSLVLNGAEVAGILIYEGNLARIAGMFSRSFTGVDRQYVSLNNYNSSSVDYNDTWDGLYATVLTQEKTVAAQAALVNDKTTVGIAQVLMAQGFGLAADLWGDVPFSEVGDPAKYPTPKFDAQADVYKGVQLLLDSAIINLSAKVGNGPGTKDIYFGGNASKWLKVAYTLKARFSLHTKDYAGAIVNAGKGISDAANNMVDPHGQSYLIDFNVYYSFLSYDRPGYMNAEGAIAPAYLDSTNTLYKGNSKTDETARFEFYYQQQLNSNGLDPNVLVSFDWGNPADQDGFFGASTPFPLVTFEENQLILAEAYIKSSSDVTNALAALNSHRAYLNTGANINSGYLADGSQYLPYVIADFAPGGIVNPTSAGLTQSNALLTEILKEKYVTLIGQIEQFNDVRRTHNFLKIPPTTGNNLPQRFLYPQDEINTNPNTPKLSAGDLFTVTTVNSTPY